MYIIFLSFLLVVQIDFMISDTNGITKWSFNRDIFPNAEVRSAGLSAIIMNTYLANTLSTVAVGPEQL